MKKQLSVQIGYENLVEIISILTNYLGHMHHMHREIIFRPEVSSMMRALSGACCSDARLYTFCNE